MSTFLLVLLLIIILGGGGWGYYGYRSTGAYPVAPYWGVPSLFGAILFIVLILMIFR
jgi:hypothetical protein